MQAHHGALSLAQRQDCYQDVDFDHSRERQHQCKVEHGGTKLADLAALLIVTPSATGAGK